MSYLKTRNKLLKVAGQELAYRIINPTKSNVPLVMLTHLAANLDNWDPKLIDLIAADRTVIVLDLPGVGASQGQVGATIPQMAQQAQAFIQALGYHQIDLLGLSMGGMIAQEIVRLDGLSINHLVLVGTAPRGGVGVNQVTSKTFKYMLQAGLTGQDPKRFIFYPHDKVGKQIAQTVLGRMQQRTKADADHPMTVTSFLRQLKAIKAWGRESSDDMSFITQPTLIVNGDKDMEVPTQNSYDMHAKIAQSQLIIYPHAGHGSIFQLADQFAVDLAAFLSH